MIYVQKRESGGDFELKEGAFPVLVYCPPLLRRGGQGVIYVQKRESGGDLEKKRSFPTCPILFSPSSSKRGIKGVIYVQKRESGVI